MEDRRPRLHQARHGHEPPSHLGVPLGHAEHPVDIAARDPHRPGRVALHLGIGEVGPGGQLPRGRDRGQGALEGTSGQVVAALGQSCSQRERLLRGHAHALAVDRVEGAHGVAGHDQPLGHPGEQVVAAPDAGRVSVGCHRAQRLGGAHDVHRPVRQQLLGHREHPLAGRLVREGMLGAHHREGPGPALAPEQRDAEVAARARGPRSRTAGRRPAVSRWSVWLAYRTRTAIRSSAGRS